MITDGLVTDQIKEQVLKGLLPIAASGDEFLANGDIKDKELNSQIKTYYNLLISYNL